MRLHLALFAILAAVEATAASGGVRGAPRHRALPVAATTATSTSDSPSSTNSTDSTDEESPDNDTKVNKKDKAKGRARRCGGFAQGRKAKRGFRRCGGFASRKKSELKVQTKSRTSKVVAKPEE